MIRDSREQHDKFMERFCKIVMDGLQKLYQCKVCSKDWIKVTSLKYHVKLAHTDIRDYHCNICNTGYVERYDCLRHVNKSHDISLAEAAEKHVIQNIQVVNWEDVEINAEEYKDASYQFERVKKKRRQIVNTVQARRTNRQHDIFLERFCRTTRNGDEKTYECKICCKSMISKITNLKYHVKSAHTNIRDYLCALCNAGYTERYNCLRHVFRAHDISVTDDSERYVIQNTEVINWEDVQINDDKWSDPDVPFEKIDQDSAEAFELSYANVFTDGRLQRFECKQCDMFAAENIMKLREHVAAAHGGPKNYRCNACNVEFFRREGFVGHVSQIHPEHLDVANRMAPKPGEMVMQSSEDHKCSTCETSFSSAFHLTKHQEIVHEGGGGDVDSAQGTANGSSDRNQSIICELCGQVSHFM